MKIGDKVICIDGNFKPSDSCIGFPQPIKGKVYTVVGVYNNGEWLGLAEMNHRHAFRDYHFKKIEPNFTNHLTRELASKQIWEDRHYLEHLDKPKRVFNKDADF